MLRPAKELKGFAKVSLAPGESRRVTVMLDRSSFSFYDVVTEDFVMEKGVFTILVGRSSADIALQQDITL